VQDNAEPNGSIAGRPGLINFTQLSPEVNTTWQLSAVNIRQQPAWTLHFDTNTACLQTDMQQVPGKLFKHVAAGQESTADCTWLGHLHVKQTPQKVNVTNRSAASTPAAG
jgi:hypothetical protein